jgi:hypothetical protein
MDKITNGIRTLIMILAPSLPCRVPTSAREILVNHLDPLLSGTVSLSSLLLGVG